MSESVRKVQKKTGKRGAWEWSEAKEQAAQMLWEGRLTQAEIGRRVGVSDRQLRRWKRTPEFAVRIQEMARATQAAYHREFLQKLAQRWR